MKALVLAAGFGTRLAPYTHVRPKPLFTINNRTVLDLAVEKLVHAGCSTIYVNAHHLHDQIEAHIRDLARSLGQRQASPMPVKGAAPPGLTVVVEPEILDTGGAIANLAKELGPGSDRPSLFIVINADIVWDMDLAPVVAAHTASGALATLVVHDCPRFNKVCVAPDGRITGFHGNPDQGLAFTGIQVLSPEIFDYLPGTPVFSSIDLYQSLAPLGRIRAFKAQGLFWNDIGTCQDYQETARACLAARVLDLPLPHQIRITPLAGDGSDRLWFRAAGNNRSVVISDHGICLPGNDAHAQLKAFVNIGRHLKKNGISVPAILGHDTLSGQVALEDLGNTHLADLVLPARQNAPAKEARTLSLYRQVIDQLILFSQKGIQDFDPAWTCQTPDYSKALILEKECRYFLEAFVNGYCRQTASWETYESEFNYIADQALAHGLTGLMHRDLQSRNIMVSQDRIWFIDFQSARKGPIQYDLASLLIDPYVTLAPNVQEALLAHALAGLNLGGAASEFLHTYQFCCLTRNLQALGAFGFLTRVKKKKGFNSHIPAALTSLVTILDRIGGHGQLPGLTALARQLISALKLEPKGAPI